MKIIIYGSGKMAELIWHAFTYDSPHEVVAFCVDDQYLSNDNSQLFKLPILNFEEILIQFPPKIYSIHIGVGRNSARAAIYQKVLAVGYSFVNYISSRSNIWPDLVFGENIFIDQDCRIHPFVSIGNNCILIGARIGHHCKINNNVLLSCTTLAGNVTVGDNSFLGINSGVKEDVIIGKFNVIGASVFINRCTEDYALYFCDLSHQYCANSKKHLMFNKTHE